MGLWACIKGTYLLSPSMAELHISEKNHMFLGFKPKRIQNLDTSSRKRVTTTNLRLSAHMITEAMRNDKVKVTETGQGEQ